MTRCHGEGEITVNPAYPDPRGETSVRCPGCIDCRDLYGYDADRDRYSETGVYDDFPRPSLLGHPNRELPGSRLSSPNAPAVERAAGAAGGPADDAAPDVSASRAA